MTNKNYKPKPSDAFAIDLGVTIINARKKLGLSQIDLALETDIDKTYLCKIETGQMVYPPSEKVLRRLADRLGLDCDRLVYLAGRITKEEQIIVRQLAQTHGKDFSRLLRILRDNPDLVRSILEVEGKRCA